MNRHKTSQSTKYNSDALSIWRTKLKNVKHGLLPSSSNDRPNPLVTESLVIASVFSPGAVCALERSTGRLVWRREVLGFCGAAVYGFDGKLFAKSSHTLYALNPNSGEVLWTFCPYGPSGETMYSEPAGHKQSVFIGDRRGILHCLDARTGRTLWRRRTNKAKNGDVNSTPIISSGLVIVGTNADKAVAYDAETGELAWVRKVDGPSAKGPLLFQRFAAILTDSIYLLESRSGRVVRKFSWQGNGIRGATSTPRTIAGILEGKWPPAEETQLVGVDKSQIRYSVVHKCWGGAIRYARDMNLVYLSDLEHIRAFDPNDGRSVFDIRLGEKRPEFVGPVEVTKKIIYALTGVGHVYALHHPQV
jgi:outer membrane protein assembly factor BamB